MLAWLPHPGHPAPVRSLPHHRLEPQGLQACLGKVDRQDLANSLPLLRAQASCRGCERRPRENVLPRDANSPSDPMGGPAEAFGQAGQGWRVDGICLDVTEPGAYIGGRQPCVQSVRAVESRG